ncbi:protein tyrosine phosphatase domain-containing protein 1 [Callorhinchus milii]|uniref:protein tyrosine phosphatase domain-containing protein 1 n=1 Tax=Callorhinchus milii TaxID=7868 RepID=UPI001C3FB301|nr:protein tyrosine phosphatase domain-containing protein 1 [Callorhinchus milii]
MAVPVPRAVYSQARENLLRAVPPHLVCSLLCHGKECRYEGPQGWSPQQQAIRGVFSAWVTDDILAMARPTSLSIRSYQLIEQFKALNVKSLINLQLAGEHAHCGGALEQDSGFSYQPQLFMDNNIYFFNFGMPDFGVASLLRILDGVKVMAFALEQGKLAVHCHAGLGRTGVLVACYLVYAAWLSPSEAVHFVRLRRPMSIQTSSQINLVFEFGRLVTSHRAVYTRDGQPITLQQHLDHQRQLLHGYEARHLKYLPKPVDFLCRRLLSLSLGRESCAVVRTEIRRAVADRRLAKQVWETLNARVGSRHTPPWAWQPVTVVLPNTTTQGQALPNTNTNSTIGGDSLSELELEDWISERPCSALTLVTLTTPTQTETHLSNLAANEPIRRQVSGMSLLESVAMAMAAGPALEEELLGKVHLWQARLSEEQGAWGWLATETDPRVLSALLWSWLEHLKEPVLRSEDVVLLLSKPTAGQSLWELEKCRDETLSCVLETLSKLSGLTSALEEAILHRLLRAVTQCGDDDLAGLCDVKERLKVIVREHRSHYLFPRGLVKTATLTTITSCVNNT